jgi:aspartyl-tRNA(Asn)/glutamyl-tRNA(Gln) amidotransferase subunit B
MPPLPRALFEKYTQGLNLSEYDAYNLTDSKAIALYFEHVILHTSNYKAAANWIMGEVKSYLNEQGIDIESFPIEAPRLAGLINLIHEGKVSNTTAAQKIFPLMLTQSDSALSIAEQQDLIQTTDNHAVETAIKHVLDANPAEVLRYKNGENQLIGFFMGQFMKASGGKVDPKTANQALRNALEA